MPGHEFNAVGETVPPLGYYLLVIIFIILLYWSLLSFFYIGVALEGALSPFGVIMASS